ncbi:hypothetical protein DYB25_001816 [Aphanomyces astaci]|uniref:FYVE-type domain-containing protein n=2 Tax=Aphanomyces astaci TaxID=112090 RepID=A0A397EHJ1_APHAT|nr:hypothetical protein DYB25_001816 [Aphanomyces astaci]RHY44183.1 hypothetical protein DYB38_001266 [Aphanomyces astaci]RHY53175.1 hypothetical protein DYB34_000787 [Aphanomyces astaci]RHY79083.1 hypothetical protein DYB30_003880 [Aphanomyces astaci]RHZ11956.1 hypothetical protein DYB31_001134 [Aphanomyces astaci]
MRLRYRYDVPALLVLCIEEIEALLVHCQNQIMDIIYFVDSGSKTSQSTPTTDAVGLAKHRLMALCMSTIMAMPDAQMQAYACMPIYIDGPSREEALRLPDDQGVLPFVAALNSANDAIIRRVLVPASLSWVTLTSSVSVWFLLACASGNLLHCQILADMHHADVNEISAVESSDEFGKGQTPLHIASVVLVLLKMSEDRAMESKDIAAADDTSEPQRELDTDQPAFSIDADDYKSVSSTDCNTALHLAAMAPQGRVDKILQVLLENGADPNRPNWFDGSTPLHLAVGKASEAISIALVRAGAPVYVQDVAGRSVVNLAESTSQGVMVVPLLLNVRTPPPWVTDDTVLECLSCGEGFGMATRKHHCRHCGRIVCATCSTNRIPLPKFDQVPAARVCDICFDVLSFRKLM